MEGGKSIGNWFGVPPKICVHPHLETDRKYSARDIFHGCRSVFVESNETRMMRLADDQKVLK